MRTSVQITLRRHGIDRGRLVIDDTDRARSKTTTTIGAVYKLKDKASGGFVRGQTVVFLLLVSDRVTLPVGFAFYQPDPLQQAWAKQDKALKKQGLKKRDRPTRPAPNPAYPSKPELALQLLGQFRVDHPTIDIQCVLADALYASARFIDAASAHLCGVQVISQLRHNQKVRSRNRSLSLREYFARSTGVAQRYTIRGAQSQAMIVNSARLWVEAQGKKRFVVAVKYEGETDYRYLVACDLTWRTQDIIQAFTLRWLVEVFFQDWKGYEGWAALTKLPGEEGSSRSLILSLLVDHCLLGHPAQLAQLNHCQPALTVGSLINRVKVDSLLALIQELLDTEQPHHQLQQLRDTLEDYFELRPSAKHMSGRELGRLQPSPSLKYRAVA